MIVEICFNANMRQWAGAPPSGTTYRPHLVIRGTEEYLGIQFADLRKAQYGERIICEIQLLYEGVDYSKLIIGTVFDIKEGDRTVGEGIVISDL